MDAKKDRAATAETKVKKGEELLAVLKEILSDSSSIIERLGAIEEKLNRALPPNPGRFTRL